MKQLGVLLIGIFFVAQASAFEVEIYTERTEQAPGFFAVTLEPPTQGEPMEIHNVYVKNFDEEQGQLFDELLPLITEFGGKVIEKEEENRYAQKEDVRLVALGDSFDHKAEFVFIPRSKQKALEDFDHFASTQLLPIYLQNLSIETGGNVQEIYPKRVPYMTNEPIRFVGKFLQPMKTRVEIVAVSNQGEMVATIPLDLDNEEYIVIPNLLADEWEAMKNNTVYQPPSRWSEALLNLFPWLLALLGLGVILWVIARHRHEPSDSLMGEYIEEIEEHTKHNSLPFEKK